MNQSQQEETTLSADVLPSDLWSTQTRQLIGRLAGFPEVLERSSIHLEPHLLPHYLYHLASDFHSFYNAERILVPDPIIRNFRLHLVKATHQVIKIGLTILNISAPDTM